MDSDDVLSPGSGSSAGWTAPTVTTFVAAPAPIGADACTKTSAVPPSGISPSAQVTTPDRCEQLPWEALAPRNADPTGSVSARRAAAAPGPSFVTTTWYSTGCPSNCGSGESVWLIQKSAARGVRRSASCQPFRGIAIQRLCCWNGVAAGS